MSTLIDKMSQSMWSNKNGTKYELKSNWQASQFKSPDEWNLLILTNNKSNSNKLNVKLQSKELLNGQLKTSLVISWTIEEYMDKFTEVNRLKQLIAENCEHVKRRNGSKIANSTKLIILRMHFKEECSISQICNALFIPYSIVSRVIREFNHNPKVSDNWFDTTIMKANDSVIIKQAIKNYVQRIRNVFNSNNIFRHILQTFNVTLQKRSIIKFFKRKDEYVL